MRPEFIIDRLPQAPGPGPEPSAMASGAGSDASAARMADELEDLMIHVADLPCQRPAMTHILSILGQDEASASDVATAVSLDPVLAAKVMRQANSAYYGVSGRVGTLPFAVTVIGFDAVRATALTSLLADDVSVAEWQMACAHAVAAGQVAPRVGAPVQEAFCAGLLADLGRSVLRQLSPIGYARVTASVDTLAELPQAELAWCGRTHQDVAREVFTAWSFPIGIVAAAAAHHDVPDPRAEPLTMAVAAGHEIAARMLGQPPAWRLAFLTRGRFTDDDFAAMLLDLAGHADDLRRALVA